MTISSSYTDTKPAPAWPVFGLIGAGFSAVLAAVGTFWDITGNDSRDDSTHTKLGQYGVVLGIIVVAALLIFGLVVRTASPTSGGIRAVVLGVLAVLSLAVFWAGLPVVFAAGAASCALTARGSGRMGGAATTGLVLAGLATALAVVMAITA